MVPKVFKMIVGQDHIYSVRFKVILFKMSIPTVCEMRYFTIK